MIFLPTWLADFHGLPASSVAAKAGAVAPTARSTGLSSAARARPTRPRSIRATVHAVSVVATQVRIPSPPTQIAPQTGRRGTSAPAALKKLAGGNQLYSLRPNSQLTSRLTRQGPA